MRKLVLFLFVMACTVGFCHGQNTVKKNKMRPTILKDSVTVQKIQQLKESASISTHQADTIVTNKDFYNNIDGILELQKEQKAKQRKAAIVRIAIGTGMLILLIVGLMRRRKTKLKS